MTTLNVETVYNEAALMLRQLNIPVGNVQSVTVNSRLTSSWGRCRKIRGKKNSYAIEISERLMNFGSPEGILNTMLHELLHTCPRCFNHKQPWKNYAEAVYNKYGINVKRTNNEQEKGMDTSNPKEKGYKYVVKCEKCGLEQFHKKETKVIKNIKAYQCSKCHCPLTLVRL